MAEQVHGKSSSPFEWSRRTMLLLLVVACGLLFFVDLGFGSLRNWDEGIYASCSQEMHHLNVWLTPHINGGPWIDKPPVYFWLTRVSFYLVGINEWAVRLPAAMAGLGTVLLSFLIAERLWDQKTGLLAAGILLSTQQFLIYSKQGQFDVPLTMFILLAIYFFLLGLEKKYLFLASGLFSAIACLTKQLLGFFAWPIIILYLALRREWKILFSPLMIASALLSLLVAASWFYQQYNYHEQARQTSHQEAGGGEKFLTALFGKHVKDRLSEGVQSDNTAWYYYLSVMLTRNKATTALALLALLSFVLGKRSSEESGFSKEWLFVLTWTIFTFLFFSVVTSKAKWYLLPFYPAFAILLARVFVESLSVKRLQYLGIVMVLMIAGTAAFSRQVYHRDFNPDFKLAIADVQALVPAGETVVFMNPEDTEPAIGFYMDRPIHAIRSKDVVSAITTLDDILQDNKPTTAQVIISRKSAWTAIEESATLRPLFEIVGQYHHPDVEDTLVVFKRKNK